MLPAVLSEDLCSLRGGQDRYAMSVLWSFNPTVFYLLPFRFRLCSFYFYRRAWKLLTHGMEEQ